MSPRGADEAEAAGTTRWVTVCVVVLAAVAATMQIGKAPPALPAIRADLGLGMVAAGWAVSLITLIGALIGVATGILADRLGHRRVVAGGLACLVLGSVAGSMADSSDALLMTRFFEGIGYVAVVVAGTPLIVLASAPRHRPLTLGVWSAYFPAGVGLMMALSPAFLETIGWRGLWLANATMLAVLVPAFLIAAPADRTAPPFAPAGPGWRDARVAALHPGPWLLATMFFLAALSLFAVMTWLPTFLVDGLGRSPGAAALLSALFVALFVPANILGGWLLRWRVKSWHVFLVGSLAMAVLPIGVFAADVSDTAKVAYAVTFAFTAGLLPGAIFAALPIHTAAPRHAGIAAGVVAQGSNLGNLLGPPLLAAVVARLGGWERSDALFLIVGGLGVVTALAVRRAELRLIQPAPNQRQE